MKVAILVPRRDDGGWRDRLWAHCKAIWEKEFPDWPIYEGHHLAEEGPFNRSAAINRAASAAGDWDVALIIDGDTISDPAAIRRAVQFSGETGDISIAHNQRLMLNRRGTELVLQGRKSNLRQYVKKIWFDTVSCAVAIRRDTWDAVHGFDERFVGWGYEDTAFYIACETVTGRAAHKEKADCLHLWHESPPEAHRLSPTLILNGNLKLRYQAVHWDREGLEAVIAGEYEQEQVVGPIPKIIHRTLPERVDEQVEKWWADFAVLHPDWELRTWRDPLNPSDFPLTGHLHSQCSSGAQKAGLVRLELLVTHGGVYVDSDVQPVRPLDALMHLPAFAAWEDERVVPDAVMAAIPQHPAFRQMLAQAVRLIEMGDGNAWTTGPGVSTAVLPGRDDVLLLPPGSFYPVHYKEKGKLGTRNELPWVFLEHKWHHSWDPKKTPTSTVSTEVLEIPQDLVICMPWRDSGDERRRRAYKWCMEWWTRYGFQVVVGQGQSRAQMCNDAAEQAQLLGAKVLVFADADTWAPASQVLAAAEAARKNVLVHAFESYNRMDTGTTQAMLRRQQSSLDVQALSRRGKPSTVHVSGLSAISVELWNQVGGFDERFMKWGFEDQAFHLACEVLGGVVERVPGTAIHWAHGMDPTQRKQPDSNALNLMSAYCSAAGRIPEHGRTGKLGRAGLIVSETVSPNPIRMREVLAEEGGPLWARSAVS